MSQLRGSHSPDAAVPALFSESIRFAFLGAGGDPERLASFLQGEHARMSQSPTYSSGIGLGESSIGWRLTRPALARALSLHLITCKSDSLTIHPLPTGLTRGEIARSVFLFLLRVSARVRPLARAGRVAVA